LLRREGDSHPRPRCAGEKTKGAEAGVRGKDQGTLRRTAPNQKLATTEGHIHKKKVLTDEHKKGEEPSGQKLRRNQKKKNAIPRNCTNGVGPPGTGDRAPRWGEKTTGRAQKGEKQKGERGKGRLQ